MLSTSMISAVSRTKRVRTRGCPPYGWEGLGPACPNGRVDGRAALGSAFHRSMTDFLGEFSGMSLLGGASGRFPAGNGIAAGAFPSSEFRVESFPVDGTVESGIDSVV